MRMFPIIVKWLVWGIPYFQTHSYGRVSKKTKNQHLWVRKPGQKVMVQWLGRFGALRWLGKPPYLHFSARWIRISIWLLSSATQLEDEDSGTRGIHPRVQGEGENWHHRKCYAHYASSPGTSLKITKHQERSVIYPITRPITIYMPNFKNPNQRWGFLRWSENTAILLCFRSSWVCLFTDCSWSTSYNWKLLAVQWPFQDGLEVPTIYKAYFLDLCKGISLQNMDLYGTVPLF